MKTAQPLGNIRRDQAQQPAIVRRDLPAREARTAELSSAAFLLLGHELGDFAAAAFRAARTPRTDRH